MLIIRSHFTDQFVIVPNAPIELRPDQVFAAANRIEDLATDLARLPHEWEREVRRAIDVIGMPSLSVGDAIYIMTSGVRGVRTDMGGWRVEPIGWTRINAETSAPVTRRALMASSSANQVAWA